MFCKYEGSRGQENASFNMKMSWKETLDCPAMEIFRTTKALDARRMIVWTWKYIEDRSWKAPQKKFIKTLLVLAIEAWRMLYLNIQIFWREAHGWPARKFLKYINNVLLSMPPLRNYWGGSCHPCPPPLHSYGRSPRFVFLIQVLSCILCYKLHM